ncbi:F1-ATP synthase [Copromyces sp. CBS 386.78]|nr:F1-ATP synthase [Copromyces sp. CBS 386.78]
MTPAAAAAAMRMRLAAPLLRQRASLLPTAVLAYRSARAIHSSPPEQAKVVPVYGTGPPPEPPKPAAGFAPSSNDSDPPTRNGGAIPETQEGTAADPWSRISRRKRQAAMLRAATLPPTAGSSSASGGIGLKRRFWKTVTVVTREDMNEIHLDSRALRRPDTKNIIRLPLTKPSLASALAIEWDQLVSAQQATKQHLIPLTSLVCRALDIADEDALGKTEIRDSIAKVLLRYLDTDSLLCWAPVPTHPEDGRNDAGYTLRELQEEAYSSVVSFLTTRVWPGVTIVPVLDETSIMPRQQEPGTREVVHGWMLGLSAWELAALERVALAGKSLLMAARLVVEWSGDGGNAVVQTPEEEAQNKKRWGIEEAARAVSLEVDWQTTQWGEVEDTHDVEKVDLRRQLGSAVLLCVGQGATDVSVNKAKL